MELERLEILLDINTARVQEALDRITPQVERAMKKMETFSARTMNKTESNLDMGEPIKKLTQQVDRMTKSFESSMDQMKSISEKGATSTARNLYQGIKTARGSVGKETDLMVKDINAKMEQARAQQQKIASLQINRQTADKTGDTGAVIKYDDQIAKANANLTKYQNSAVSMARSMRREFEAVPQSLEGITSKMEVNEGAIESLRNKIRFLNEEYEAQRKTVGTFEGGFGTEDTKTSVDTNAKMQQQIAKMNNLIAENDKLQQAYAQTEERATSLKEALGGVNTNLSESSIQTGNAALGIQTVTEKSDEARSVWSRFGGLFNRSSNNIAHGTRRMNTGMGVFGKTIKSLFRRLIVFALLYRGIMKLSRALFDSLKTNEQFKNSLNQIKVNLMTAFYPIYTAILPAINAMMKGLATVTGYLATFVATLFGTTYSAAKQGAKGLYGNVKALNATGGSAKEAAKKVKELKNSLLSFDEINRIGLDVDNPDENKSSSGDTNFNTPTPSVPKGVYDFANKMREAFKDFFKPFKAAWESQGKAVMDAWKYATGEVWGLVKAIGRSFMEVWTNGTGELFISNLLILLATVLNIVGDIAKAFKDAWISDGRGTALIQSIFDSFNAILELLIAIGQSFRDAWNDGTGEQIAAHLLDILTDVFDIVTGLADGFKNAWNEAGVGTSIFSTILGIFEDLLGHLSDMTSATKGWARNLDFTPLLQSIDGLLKKLRPLTDNIGAGLAWLYENVLLPLAKWTIEDILPAFLDILSEAMYVVNEAIEALKPTFEWLWDNMLQPIAKWTGGAIVSILEGVADALKGIGDFIGNHQTGFSNFVLAFGVFAGTLKVISLLTGAMAIFASIKHMFVGFKIAVGVFGGVKAAATVLIPIITGLSWPFIIAAGAIAGVIAVGVLLWKNWDTVKEKAAQLGSWVSDKWDGLKKATSEAWTNVSDSVKDKTESARKWGSEKVEKLQTSTNTAWSNIKKDTKDSWNEFSSTVRDKSEAARKNGSEKVEKLKSSISTSWGNLKRDTKDAWTDVSNEVSDKAESARKWGSDKVGRLQSATSTAWADVKKSTRETWDNVSSHISEKAGQARDKGSSAIRTLKSNMSTYASNMKTTMKGAFDSISGWANGLGDKIGSGLSKGLKAVKNGAKTIGEGMLGVLGKAYNGVIGGINWVLKLVGFSGKPLDEWKVTKLANGTRSHKGGPALVNDAPGSKFQESYRLANGAMGLFPKQRNMLIDLPKGAQVMTGQETATMMGDIPHYAGGIGDWFKNSWNKAKEMVGSVWDYASKPEELLDIAISKFVNLSKATEPALSMAKGGIGTIAKEATNYVKDLLGQGPEESGTGGVDFQGLKRTSKFGYRKHPIFGDRRLHAGVDYAGGGGIGHPIHAQTNGTVQKSGPSGTGFGTWVNMKNGVYDYIYAHLSKALVARGANVSRGQKIGLMGNTGDSTGAHVHYEVRKNGKAIDPENNTSVATGVERWRSTAERALRMTGQYSESNLDKTLYQMKTESSGNPRAINLWDDNFKRGTPSKGLMQVIDPTFRAYAHPSYNRDIYDPLSNILASVRYAVSRYGSLNKAYRGKGYENGGVVQREGYYKLAEQNKKELVIPLEKRSRALALLEYAQDYLGVGMTTSTIEMPALLSVAPTQQVHSSERGEAYKGSGGINDLNNNLMETLLSIVENSKKSDAPIEVIMEVDSDKIGKIAIKGINKTTKKTGVSPIII